MRILRLIFLCSFFQLFVFTTTEAKTRPLFISSIDDQHKVFKLSDLEVLHRALSQAFEKYTPLTQEASSYRAKLMLTKEKETCRLRLLLIAAPLLPRAVQDNSQCDVESIKNRFAKMVEEVWPEKMGHAEGEPKDQHQSAEEIKNEAKEEKPTPPPERAVVAGPTRSDDFYASEAPTQVDVVPRRMMPSVKRRVDKRAKHPAFERFHFLFGVSLLTLKREFESVTLDETFAMFNFGVRAYPFAMAEDDSLLADFYAEINYNHSMGARERSEMEPQRPLWQEFTMNAGYRFNLFGKSKGPLFELGFGWGYGLTRFEEGPELTYQYLNFRLAGYMPLWQRKHYLMGINLAGSYHLVLPAYDVDYSDPGYLFNGGLRLTFNSLSLLLNAVFSGKDIQAFGSSMKENAVGGRLLLIYSI